MLYEGEIDIKICAIVIAICSCKLVSVYCLEKIKGIIYVHSLEVLP